MVPNEEKIIYSLCDLTGTWSQPYREAGYQVRQFDIQLDPTHDILTLELPDEPVWGIIAQPPCTQFAGSGARWWKQKAQDHPELLQEAVSLVSACIRLVHCTQPQWWVLENPVGRLNRYIGPPVMYIQPHDYAGWADDPHEDSYTKKTGLWGNFNAPPKNPREPVLGSKMARIPPGPNRANLRSVTPQGFARAFFQANP